MEKMQNILLHHAFAEQIRMLSMEERGILLTAIYDYELGEAFCEGDLPFGARMVFCRIREYLDRNREAYAERCVQNNRNDNQNKSKHKHKNKNKNTPPPEEEAYAPAPEKRASPPLPHRLGDGERADLIEKGVPAEYINSRLSRAEEYARQNGAPIGEVLLTWWSSDRHESPWNGKRQQKADNRTVGDLGKSFDADDFFDAALQRTFREFGVSLDEDPESPTVPRDTG